MSICLVLHELHSLTPQADKAYREAIFEIAPDHWHINDHTVLLATDVSLRYLRDHLSMALRRHGRADPQLLITRLSPDTVWQFLPHGGEEWIAAVTG